MSDLVFRAATHTVIERVVDVAHVAAFAQFLQAAGEVLAYLRERTLASARCSLADGPTLRYAEPCGALQLGDGLDSIAEHDEMRVSFGCHLHLEAALLAERREDGDAKLEHRAAALEDRLWRARTAITKKRRLEGG